MCFHVSHVGEDTITGTETHDDLGDAKKEGLDPELHEFPMEIIHVSGSSDLNGRLELYPIDGAALLLRLGVPYYSRQY